MAKPLLRIKAKKLRSKGKSVKEIAESLKVSKSTASLWTRDVILTEKQLEKLKIKALRGAELGRMRGALKQKKQRLKLIKKFEREGIDKLNNLSSKQIFITGLALYWAEGAKKQRRVSFCNSDPKLIRLMVNWLESNFGVTTQRLTAYVGINHSHKSREKSVKRYWSNVTGIPLNQFTKTSFKKTKNKKIYQNHNQHYGTLTVGVLKPSRLYYKILGLIEGIKHARVAQW